MRKWQRFRRSRALRLVLVGFMVPLMVITGGSGAQAVSNGPWASTTLTVPGGLVTKDATCVVNLARVIGAQGQLNLSGDCRGGFDLSPTSAQPGEDGAHFRLSVLGPGCEGVGIDTSLTWHADDSIWAVAGTIPGFVMIGAGCEPVQVCMMFEGASDVPQGTDIHPALSGTGCGGITVEGGEQQCELVTVGPAEISEPRVRVNGNGRYHWYERDLTFRVKNVAGRQVTVSGYAVMDREPVGGYAAGQGGRTDHESPLRPGAVAHWQSYALFPDMEAEVTVTVATGTDDRTTEDVPGESSTFIGGGVFVQDVAPGTPVSWFKVPGNQPERNRLGVHDLGVCSVYFGEKLWDDGQPGTGADEPAGPLVVPPSDPVDSEGPETPDEPSWWRALWAILTQIVGAIAGVASAIAGLAGAIVTGIVNAITGLFIPSEGAIQEQIDQTLEAWEDSSPGQFVGVFTDLELPEGTSQCQGPVIDFDLYGQNLHMEPLNACEGGMATLATLSRLGITVGVVISGAFACLRGLGSGFGWRPGVGESA